MSVGGAAVGIGHADAATPSAVAALFDVDNTPAPRHDQRTTLRARPDPRRTLWRARRVRYGDDRVAPRPTRPFRRAPPPPPLSARSYRRGGGAPGRAGLRAGDPAAPRAARRGARALASGARAPRRAPVRCPALPGRIAGRVSRRRHDPRHAARAGRRALHTVAWPICTHTARGRRSWRGASPRRRGWRSPTPMPTRTTTAMPRCWPSSAILFASIPRRGCGGSPRGRGGRPSGGARPGGGRPEPCGWRWVWCPIVHASP